MKGKFQSSILFIVLVGIDTDIDIDRYGMLYNNYNNLEIDGEERVRG
jgi:hypothetical protein